MLARVDEGEVRLYTSNGQDWTARLKALAADVADLALPPCWLDGEVVVINDRGITDFQALQRAFSDRKTDTIQYFVFDLPYYAGRDLRGAPLIERRSLLQRLVDTAAAPHLHFSDAFDAPPEDILAAACRLGLEGIMGKQAARPSATHWDHYCNCSRSGSSAE